MIDCIGNSTTKSSPQTD